MSRFTKLKDIAKKTGSKGISSYKQYRSEAPARDKARLERMKQQTAQMKTQTEYHKARNQLQAQRGDVWGQMMGTSKKPPTTTTKRKRRKKSKGRRR